MRACSCQIYCSQSSGLLRMIIVDKLDVGGVILLIGKGGIEMVFCCRDRPFVRIVLIIRLRWNLVESRGISWNLVEDSSCDN